MNLSTYGAVLGLAVLSGATTLLGVVLAVYFSRDRRWVALGIGFSVGVMILISLLELIPSALAATGLVEALVAVVVGSAFVAVLHWILPHTHLVEEHGVFESTMLRTAYLVLIGLILHDLPEGFAMANSYILSPSLGVLVAIIIALHNTPEEFAMAVTVVAAKEHRFLYLAALISALAEPAGALIGLIAVQMAPVMNPLFMGAAAGAMIFVSAHELIPMAKHYRQGMLFGFGFASSAVVHLILALIFP